MTLPLPSPAQPITPITDPGRVGHVAIVSVPFASCRRPSIQLGLLKPLAERVGWQADAYHLNVDFAALLGQERYEVLGAQRAHQNGDWLFSRAAFGDTAPDFEGRLLEEYASGIATMLREMPGEPGVDWLLHVRDVLVPLYLDAMVAAVDWHRFDIIGFTSTFQQTVASFAFARRLRDAGVRATLLYGGANFDGEMGLELLRVIDLVDAVVVGEGDEAFPELLQAWSRGQPLHSVRGVAARGDDGKIIFTPRGALFNRLDELPFPEYDDFFDRAERFGTVTSAERHLVDMPFESSRGCWWGAKHHCVFCGLNANGMAFRQKSAARVLDELAWLGRRYQSIRYTACDNIIPHRFHQELVPELTRQDADWSIFYEIKANLRPQQIRSLADAGITRLQPGIESLSSPVLSRMNKGVRGIQNVNLLRGARHHGIHVFWNILWGFPGDRAEEYEAQAALLPHLVHLQPPVGGGRIWMERFSPVFTMREQYPTRSMVPERSYERIFPTNVDLSQVAYFFEYEFDCELPEESYDTLFAAIRQWKEIWHDGRRPWLNASLAPGLTIIDDGRSESGGVYRLSGVLSDIYQACYDEPTSIARVLEATMASAPEAEVLAAIDEFVSSGLIMRDDDLVLALAVPRTRTL